MAKSGERIAAGDRGFEERVQKLAGQVQARFRYHSIDLPDGSVLPGLQSVDHLRWRLGLFGLPNDLRGKRVLDIGAWDGWFSFECERRGAEVVAVDCVALDTFLEAKRLIGSRVEYLTLDVNELSARRLGRFDIVLFFGVLYHLRHPLLGLEKAVELSTGIALIESFVIAPEHRQHPAVMEYYERAELGGQIDNWCGPSPECLLSFCRSAGFAQAELLDITNQRASVLCTRHWPAPDAQPAAAAPQLRAAVNNRSYEAIFHPLKDEYLVCFFNSAEQNLTPDSLFVEVDGYGTQVLVIAADGSGGWQANCLRPPGLDPGRHEVRVRTLRSGHSNTAAFTMLDEFGRDVLAPAAALPMAAPDALPVAAPDALPVAAPDALPVAAPDALPVAAPEMCSAELRVSGDSRYAWQREGYLVCYFRSPAQTVMPGDVTIDAGGRVVQAQAISPLEPGVWQANVALNEPLAPESPVRVRLRDGEWSATAPARQRR